LLGEQRADLRYAVAVDVHIEGRDGAGGSGTTVNLSIGGLCASLDGPFEIGEPAVAKVTLLFEEATSEPLALPGRIAWCTSMDDAFQVGFQFVGLDANQRSDLGMFLNLLNRRPGHSAPSGGQG
jgi:Tfp pilus assembly protein PilZ